MPAEFVQSTLLAEAGFRHAFFTRRGGVSDGPYQSLNFSTTVGDAPANVMQNFELAASVLAVRTERVFYASQVHGAALLALSGNESADDVRAREADAVASRDATLACAVRTADCVPILAADLESGWVVAIHAGWRGVVRGAVEAGIQHLLELGRGRARLIAAIGPHIRQAAFEVGEDVAEQLERASPVGGVVDRSSEKPHVSLAAIVRAKLEHAGVASDRIDDVGGCTLSEPDRFFSFRRSGRVSGRLLSAIVARP